MGVVHRGRARRSGIAIHLRLTVGPDTPRVTGGSWRRSRERGSESSQGSSTARSRGNPDINGVLSHFHWAPTGLG